MVELFLNYNSNCHHQNARGGTALQIAVENCKTHPNSQKRKKIVELVNAKIQQTSEKELAN